VVEAVAVAPGAAGGEVSGRRDLCAKKRHEIPVRMSQPATDWPLLSNGGAKQEQRP